MLTYSLEQRGSSPLYTYLYRCIREDILLGRLQAGEKLPSKRALAEHLGVSVITVENALAQLNLEGYIRSQERSGYYVCDDCAAPLSQERPAVSRGRGSESAQEWFADFKTNATPAEQFPFSIWAKLMRQVLADRSPALLAPMPGRGLPELQEAIADFLYRFRGMSVSPRQVIIAAGTESLYGILVQLLGRDTVFAVEDPGYARISQVYQLGGARCVRVPLDASGLSVSALAQSGAQAAHLSPSHHFPTGLVMPASRRGELLNWAGEREGRYLIEDEYDSEFRFTGKPLPPLQSADRMGRVIYLNTFTKTLTPALRIGYLVLPETLQERFEERLGFLSCTVPSFEQLTLAQFLSHGSFESHLSRTRNSYRRSRDDLIQAIRESPLGDRCTIREANAGLHFLLETGSTDSDAVITQRAASLGIHVSCLSEYYFNRENAPRGCLVINYSGVPRDRMAEAVRRLAWAVLGQEKGDLV